MATEYWRIPPEILKEINSKIDELNRPRGGKPTWPAILRYLKKRRTDIGDNHPMAEQFKKINLDAYTTLSRAIERGATKSLGVCVENNDTYYIEFICIAILGKSFEQLLSEDFPLSKVVKQKMPFNPPKSGVRQYSPFRHPELISRRRRSAELFYDGHESLWSDIEQELDFKRSVYTSKDGILASVYESYNTLSKLHVFFLTGVAGAGKTTMLMRLSYDLQKNGIPVFYLNAKKLESVEEYVNSRKLCTKIIRNENKVIICINDLSLFLWKDHGFLKRIAEDFVDRKILIICTLSQPFCKTLTIKKNLPSSYQLKIREIPLLSDEDILAFYDKITSLEKVGALEKPLRQRSFAEMEYLFKHKSDRQLLVAMLQLRKDKRFVDIVREEVDKVQQFDEHISEDTKTNPILYEMYCIVCVLQVFIDKGIYDKLLYYYLGIEENVGNEYLELQTQKRDAHSTYSGLFSTTGSFIKARHVLIAQEVCNYVYVPRPEKLSREIIKLFDFSFIVNSKDSVIMTSLFRDAIISSKLLPFVKHYFGFNAVSSRKVFQHFDEYLNDDKTSVRSKFLTAYGDFESTDYGNNSFERAIPLYKEVLENYLPENSYVHVQIASCYLSAKEWELAYAHAVLAYKYRRTGDMHSILDILYRNRYEYYIQAEQIFEKEQKKAEKSGVKKTITLCKNYFDKLKVVTEAKQRYDSELFLHLLEKSRPQNAIPTYHMTKEDEPMYLHLCYEREVKQPITERLFTEMIGQIELFGDEYMQGYLYFCLGQALSKQIRDGYTQISDIEATACFHKSIIKKEKIFFSYNRFGTFYKDEIQDYDKAEQYYRLAIQHSNAHEDDIYHSYPIFSNNLALLLEKKHKKKMKPEIYYEIIELYKLAIVNESKMRKPFPYPKEHLERFQARFDKLMN